MSSRPHQSAGRSAGQAAGSPPSRPGRQHPCPLARNLPRARSTATCSLWSRETSGAWRRRRRWRERRGERSSGWRRLRSLCSHHVIYSPRATGSTGLALIIHSLSVPKFAPFLGSLGGRGGQYKKAPGLTLSEPGGKESLGEMGSVGVGGWGGGGVRPLEGGKGLWASNKVLLSPVRL